MLSYFIILFCLMCVVKSDYDTQVNWTANNVTIKTDITEYCKNKNCLLKCCPPGQFLRARPPPKKPGTPIYKCDIYNTSIRNYSKVIDKRINDLSEFNKYSWNFNNSEKSKPYFDLIQNDFYTNDVNQTITFTNSEVKILKDGSLKWSGSDINKQPALKYCVDFRLFKVNDTTLDIKLAFKIALDPEDPDLVVKQIYIATGMLISSFFMLLVLFVYSVIPCLRNIAGMVLMAYLVSLIVGFTIKGVQLIYITVGTFSTEQCENISPAIYYFILASFFWLNVMSFDLWWTVRGSYKQRRVHRQGELVKFMWYSLYAWGVPALMTLIVVIIDRKQLITNSEYKPPFRNCFAEVTPSRLYLHLPIGLMTLANCLMFVWTAYTIWSIKKTIVNVADSGNTKKQENRFVIYLKLFLLMGVSWVLEQLPKMPLIPHIIVNFFTLFIGVGIFYVFIWKKSTIKLLCKRFNINNAYVNGLQASQYSASGRNTQSSKTSSKRKTHSRHSDIEEGTELTSFTNV